MAKNSWWPGMPYRQAGPKTPSVLAAVVAAAGGSIMVSPWSHDGVRFAVRDRDGLASVEMANHAVRKFLSALARAMAPAESTVTVIVVGGRVLLTPERNGALRFSVLDQMGTASVLMPAAGLSHVREAIERHQPKEPA